MHDNEFDVDIDLAQFITELRGVDTDGAPLASRGIPLQERDSVTRHVIVEVLADHHRECQDEVGISPLGV